ncbi:MAG: hypothetical protein LBG58_04110 [Planctomycetaceae bacterium]|nr:hypothetical protein [Planctomycetaceae bacterium]
MIQEVGDLSPKGHNGWFVIRVVRGWFLISICTQGQVGYRRRNLSAKGCLPFDGNRLFYCRN